MLLSGGMIIGQGLLIVTSPLLTRLYTPEEFGLFAVFGAVIGIFGIVMSLRYEYALPQCEDDAEAAGVVGVATVAAIVLSVLFGLVTWLYGAALLELVGAAGLLPLAWLLPLSALFWGVSQPLAFWSLRRGSIRTNAINRVVHYGVQAAVQVGLGLLVSGAGGLVWGFALGIAARLVHLTATVPRADLVGLAAVRARLLLTLMRRHWRYPVFSSSASLLHGASQLLPAVLLTALYDPQTGGFFALGQRVLGLPVRLLAEQASQVVLSEVAQADPRRLYRVFRRTVALFFALGSLGMLPLVALGPPLFALVFGESWRPAGALVQALTPLFLVRFVVVPVSQILNVLGRQELHLSASILGFAALVGSFATGHLLALGSLETVWLYSITSALGFALYLALAWRLARRAAALADAAAEPRR